MTDNSYTLIENAFQRFIADGCVRTADDVDVIRNVFFAGASAVMGTLRRSELSSETIVEELVDFCTRRCSPV